MQKWKRRLLCIPSLIMVVVIVSLFPRYGDWLGYLFPVTTKATNIKVERVPGGGTGAGGWTRVTFDFKKHHECRWVAMRIYWVDKDGFKTRIPWKALDDSARPSDLSRPTGLNRITILVGSTLQPERWYMDAYHDCHPLLPNFKTVLLP